VGFSRARLLAARKLRRLHGCELAHHAFSLFVDQRRWTDDQPCILSVALALRLRHHFTRPLFAAFLCVTVLVSLCKTIYFTVPLAVLPLVLSSLPFSSRETRIRTFQVLAAALLPTLIWSALTRHTFSVWNTAFAVDPAAQLQYVLSHPFLVLHKFALQLFRHLGETRAMLVGVLGWLDTRLGQGYSSCFRSS